MNPEDKPDALEIREMLAFELFTILDKESNDFPREHFAQKWRAQPEIRKAWRQTAETLEAFLEEAGLGFRIKRTPDFRKALKAVITIPERAAYRIGDE
jgi:hypothetical protein